MDLEQLETELGPEQSWALESAPREFESTFCADWRCDLKQVIQSLDLLARL